jgi:peptidoglycan/LPS O-acetylase OafA/YrhL
MKVPAEILVASMTVAWMLLGTVSVVAAVRLKGCRWQRLFQRLFVTSLVCLAACTLSALGEHDLLWLSGGVACAGLAVGATLDFRPSPVGAL